VKQAGAWYHKALELARAGDHGAVAALVALLLGMRASEIVSRRVADLDEDQEDQLRVPMPTLRCARRKWAIPRRARGGRGSLGARSLHVTSASGTVVHV
jgi:integrase